MTAALFNWRRLLVAVVVVAVITGLIIQRKTGEDEDENVEKVLSKVTVQRLDELSRGGVIEKMATVEAAS